MVVRTEANLSRLRKENSDLRRTLALYEEAIRRLAIENDALRSGAAVIRLPDRSTCSRHPRRPESDTAPGGVWRAEGRWASRAANYR
ncbi:hypothetical protein [Streptomyces afghaniensis]|uniref:hypothetical protein n=1 Tax=Streptomyces afghaniensis TaxID=66865 RepID=UPI00379A8CD6